jgi:hypothetical protein
MSKIDIEINNIGGSAKYKASLMRGKVNMVIGSSSSGKSSIMRGLHFGLVGKVPVENVYLDEMESLHLNDRSSDQALLLRNSKEGNASIKFDSTNISATIPSTGNISSSNGQPKALFTTMLSGLPPTRLQQAIWKPDPSNPNDFQWIVDDLSDAGKYQTWHDSLERLNQEAKSIRIKYQEWVNKRANADSIRSELTTERNLIEERKTERAMKKGSVDSALEKKITSERSKLKTARDDIDQKEPQYLKMEAELGESLRIIDDAKREEKIATRKLHEAEELLENEPFEPDVSQLDDEINKAKISLQSATGENTPSHVKDIFEIYSTNSQNVSPKELAVAIQNAIDKSGNDEKASIAKQYLRDKEVERDEIVNDYLSNKRNFGMAEQQAGKARASIKEARGIINDKDIGSDFSVGQMRLLKEQIDDSKRKRDAAQEKIKEYESQKGDEDPESKKDDSLLEKIEKQLSQIEQSQAFEFRFITLGMSQSDSFKLTDSKAKDFLGDGNIGKARKDIILSQLGIGLQEIRNALRKELDKGLLCDIEATANWAAEEADRQRQETRRVFNEQGTSMFAKLKVSAIKAVSLDTDYELKIDWDDGSKTGLTGAGGERTIIAAALLIAMRKSYTPNIPLLMFDGVLENLDDRPREELLNFLANYAEEENIAVIVSIFDSSIKEAKIIER